MRIATALFIVPFIASAAAAQQPSDLLLHQDFETGPSGWTALGAGNTLEVTHQPGQPHSGNGALALNYTLKRGQLAAAVLPAPPALARMTHLRFWIKTDHDAPLGVALNEKKPGGGNYVAWLWSPANTWQQIDLTPADFILADGPQDPKDPDNKLDLDQLQAVGILDIGPMLPAPPSATPAPAVSHTLWIDDFEAIGGSPSAGGAAIVIDTFNRGFLQWITTGAVDMKLAAADNPLHEPALEASYQQTEPPLPSMLRRISNYDLAKAARVDFDIASDEETTLVVALEIKKPGSPQGPRFTLPIYPPGKREVFHVSVKLEDFQGQGKLDPADLKTLIITDPSGGGDNIGVHNRIWIGKVEFRTAQ